MEWKQSLWALHLGGGAPIDLGCIQVQPPTPFLKSINCSLSPYTLLCFIPWLTGLHILHKSRTWVVVCACWTVCLWPQTFQEKPRENDTANHFCLRSCKLQGWLRQWEIVVWLYPSVLSDRHRAYCMCVCVWISFNLIKMNYNFKFNYNFML